MPVGSGNAGFGRQESITMQKLKFARFLMLVCCFAAVHAGWCQEPSGEISPMAQVGAEGLTFWQMIRYGGLTMFFIGLLSVFACLLVIYQALTLSSDKILQPGMVRRVYALINQGKISEAEEYCKRHSGPVAAVLHAGLRRVGKEHKSIVEAMETVGSREAESLRERNRLLADIATIAPMLGLFGTVVGLIGAFNVIAFDVSIVRPIMLASQVSKALITTAAGLVVGIPSMAFYYYFRSVLQKHLSAIEILALEFSEWISSLRVQEIEEPQQ